VQLNHGISTPVWAEEGEGAAIQIRMPRVSASQYSTPINREWIGLDEGRPQSSTLKLVGLWGRFNWDGTTSAGPGGTTSNSQRSAFAAFLVPQLSGKNNIFSYSSNYSLLMISHL